MSQWRYRNDVSTALFFDFAIDTSIYDIDIMEGRDFPFGFDNRMYHVYY